MASGWTLTAARGTASTVTSPVYSGSSALRYVGSSTATYGSIFFSLSFSSFSLYFIILPSLFGLLRNISLTCFKIWSFTILQVTVFQAKLTLCLLPDPIKLLLTLVFKFSMVPGLQVSLILLFIYLFLFVFIFSIFLIK